MLIVIATALLYLSSPLMLCKASFLRRLSRAPVGLRGVSSSTASSGGAYGRTVALAGILAVASLSSAAAYKSRGISGLHSSALQAHCEGAPTGSQDKFAETRLYPSSAPYAKGKLQVSAKHTIAYSLYGNPEGKPVLFVHGGPGGGTDPAMARFFDPKAYLIVLVDQRGCGESTPFASLDENTTYDSVRDFEKLRVKLGIDKWQVFGGSWGSTLALAYAMENPSRVTELVLRGIFLLREKEIEWLYQRGASYLFPEDWAAYEAAIPPCERGDFLLAYGRRLRGELGDEEMRRAAKAWSIWEGRTSKLVQDPWEVVKDRFGADDFSLAFARIENHYFTNKVCRMHSSSFLLAAQTDDPTPGLLPARRVPA